MSIRMPQRSPTRSRGGMLMADDGSAIAEFVMVVALLTVLTLSVIQLGLALLVRNTVLDAAAEGARYAALADNSLADGQRRTRELIATAIGAGYAADIRAQYGSYLGQDAVTVTVRTPLPLIGLVGLESGMEVSGHAAVETLDGAVTRG
jgi:Flp pilus assembly protein TadG